MSALTPVQLARIARNRQAAAARRVDGVVAVSVSLPLSSAPSSAVNSSIPTPTSTRRVTAENVNNADNLLPKNAVKNDSANANSHRNTKRSWASNYYEYNFSEMKDSRGGYLVDDAPGAGSGDQTDAQTAKKLRQKSSNPVFEEPPMSLDPSENPHCIDCNTVEIDYTFQKSFRVNVCRSCKDQYTDKYSLLTKTEARQDYLLTEGELRDGERLPYITRPNPHKSTYHDMWLYLRMQVETFAIEKWGSLEKLDEEYQRRVEEKECKKERNYKQQLKDLRNRTRTSIWQNQSLKNADQVVHTHRWVRQKVIEDDDNNSHTTVNESDHDESIYIETCAECGAKNEVEEF